MLRKLELRQLYAQETLHHHLECAIIYDVAYKDQPPEFLLMRGCEAVAMSIRPEPLPGARSQHKPGSFGFDEWLDWRQNTFGSRRRICPLTLLSNHSQRGRSDQHLAERHVCLYR